jgi:ribonuclease-3
LNGKIPPDHELDDALGHGFADRGLLIAALTHSSLSKSARHHHAGAFERLEFLGDRVLGLVIADLLTERFPRENEGDLARRHAALVNRDALADVARRIDLGRFLRLAKSEEESGGRGNPAVLADALEAVIAALYRDGGFAAAAGFVRRHFQPLLEAAVTPPSDAKTALQEWAQARGLPLPKYRTLTSEGPAHRPRFVVEVNVADVAPEVGEGASKRVAEREAAAALLRRIGVAIND